MVASFADALSSLSGCDFPNQILGQYSNLGRMGRSGDRASTLLSRQIDVAGFVCSAQRSQTSRAQAHTYRDGHGGALGCASRHVTDVPISVSQFGRRFLLPAPAQIRSGASVALLLVGS